LHVVFKPIVRVFRGNELLPPLQQNCLHGDPIQRKPGFSVEFTWDNGEATNQKLLAQGSVEYMNQKELVDVVDADIYLRARISTADHPR
jgi:hypothetical protein